MNTYSTLTTDRIKSLTNQQIRDVVTNLPDVSSGLLLSRFNRTVAAADKLRLEAGLLLAIWNIPDNHPAFWGWFTASAVAYSNMLLKRNT